MSTSTRDQYAHTEATDSGGRSLYRIGGVAALICALMYLIALGVYIPANLAGPPPGTVREWLTLYQTDPLTGLIFLGLADIGIVLLWGPMSLSPALSNNPTEAGQ